MSVEKDSKQRLFTVGTILALTFSCCVISSVKVSPKIEWAQTSDPSAAGNSAWRISVDASGIYVVGFDSSLGLVNVEWRIEKVSEKTAFPFYMQPLFTVSILVVAVIILFDVAVIMKRKAV